MSTTTGSEAKSRPKPSAPSGTPTELVRTGSEPVGTAGSRPDAPAGGLGLPLAALRAWNPVTIAKTILPPRQIPIQQIAFYGIVVALAGVGVIEAPLAAVVIGGRLLHGSRQPHR